MDMPLHTPYQIASMVSLNGAMGNYIIPAVLVLLVIVYWKRKYSIEVKARKEVEDQLKVIHDSPENQYANRIDELEQENALLIAQEAQSRMIINNVRDIIWTADENMNLTYISPAILQVRGYTPEESIRNGLKTVGPPETIDKLIKRFKTDIQRNPEDEQNPEKEKSLEIEMYRKDGSTFFAEILVTILRDDTGVLTGFLGVTRDISKRKDIELSFEENMTLLNEIGRTAQVGGWEMDAKTKEMTYTDEMFRILELPLDWSVPTFADTLEYYLPDERDTVVDIVDYSIKNQEPYDGEIQLRTAKGNNIWTRVILHPYVVDGETIKLVGTFQDITALKTAEAATRDHNARSSAILNTVADAIVTTDEEGIIESANSATTKIFGYTTDELLGQHIKLLMPEPNHTEHGNFPRTARTTELNTTLNTAREIHGLHKDGHEFPIRLRTSEVMLDNRRLFTDVIQDMTNEYALEQQLLQAQKMDSLGILAGGIAHDFNNILTGIVGYISMAKMQIADDDELMNRYITEIEAGSQRAAKLVSQILTFSRTSDIILQPLDIHKVTTEAISFIRASIPSTIEITTDLISQCGYVLGDNTQIHQLITNLCTNAHHSMEDSGNGQIMISLKPIVLESPMDTLSGTVPSGNYVQLSIADIGKGIPPEVFDHLLEPFFTTKDVGKGTGLGLSVVHGIAKRMGAGLRIDSQVGEGTTVLLLFPALGEKWKDIPQKL